MQLKMLKGRQFVLSVFCFTAFCNIVIAEREVYLDMAPDAVDDLYEGCTNEALDTFVQSDLLRKELGSSEAFETTCTKVIPGRTKEYTYALLAYINSAETFKKTLNDAVYSRGTNVSTYKDSFHFKSLHFLLMDTIRLLNQTHCNTVYALSDPKLKAHKGSNVRFGRFYTGTSFETLTMEELIDDDVVLNITTCFSAHLGANICSKEQMTLISPAEEFTVKDVETVTQDGESYQMIVLTHSKLNSKHNCYIFSRSPADMVSHWLVLALLASSFYIIN